MNTVMDFIYDVLIYGTTNLETSKEINFHVLCFGKITYENVKGREYPRTAKRTYYKWYYLQYSKHTNSNENG